MKICQVLGSKGFAGLEYHAIELCNRLSRKGHDVVLIAHPGYRDRLDDTVKLEPVDLSGWRYNPVVLLRLLLVLRRHSPDIIHAQANKAAKMVALLGRWLPGRHVATLHGQKSNTRIFRRFDRVIAVSHAVAEGLTGVRVAVIYNGIESPKLPDSVGYSYLRNEFAIDIRYPVVAAVGRLVQVKGFDILLQAWVGINADLILVGEGPERQCLEDLVTDLGLGDRVHLVGYRQDVPSILASVDLVVISSRREGFSYVMAESLFVRTVVVATRVPGPLDLLPDYVLAACENPIALRRRIVVTLNDIDHIRNKFEPIWDYALDHLTMDNMVGRTEDLYHEALERP